ncbi:hypothetical protein H9L39_05795 [Fusarium oxysporum f. sp. albedinis]|jgi:hypothetical protein|nr:hypothetical protein H9L39_05795 [Fusarium oxysporum f. sp. albedinis]
MGHPEYAVPVYLCILAVLLVLWLLLPVVFIMLLVVKSRLERREVDWLEEGYLVPEDEMQMNYETFLRART